MNQNDFFLKDESYMPDFFIEEWDCFVEIKGWDNKAFRKKFNKFKPIIKKKIIIIKSKQIKKYKEELER